MNRNSQRQLLTLLALVVLFCSCFFSASAQSKDAPLTSQELVRLVYQFSAHPEKKEEIINEIRRRGIGFALTSGLRSVVASKSGNDADLRRTLEEAERRRLNPVATALPSEAEGRDVLEKARTATLAAAAAMPDFIVKQQITRSFGRGGVNNWTPLDRLTIAVSYRAKVGEEYRVLAVNGIPYGGEAKDGRSYEQLGGTSSTGEYVTMLSELFAPETKAKFNMVDTNVLRGRRTIVYEFEVEQPFSKLSIKATGAGEQSVIAGYRGRVWIDRETFRVLRMEHHAIDLPADFPIKAASSVMDYDWVSIAERQYLLPSQAEIILTADERKQKIQTRNVIRFRSYQRFGSEVKFSDDVEEDEPATATPPAPSKPAKP